jgi:hypothetical protein
VAFWVYKKFEQDNLYYETVAPNRGDMNFLERSVLSLERERDLEISREEAVLRKYQSGEIDQGQYEMYLENQRKKEMQELDDAFESMGKMYDPDKGILSGAIKMKSMPEFQKSDQVKMLDERIDRVVSELGKVSSELTIVKLRSISWTPIGDSKIDKEMTRHYERKVGTIINELRGS